MILAAALLVYFGCSAVAIRLGHVQHLDGRRLRAVVVLAVIGQIASLLVPVALLYS
jgi:hypothetical protein